MPHPSNPENEEPPEPSPKEILQRLHTCGLLTHLCYSKNRNHIFCFVALPIEQMRLWADTRATDVKLDPTSAVLFGRTKAIDCLLAKNTFLPNRAGESELEVRRVSTRLNTSAEVKFKKLRLELWENVFVQYDAKVPENIYAKHSDGSIFSNCNQLQMLDEIIKAARDMGGAKLKIMEMAATSHPVCAVFAIDDHKRVTNLIPAKVYWKFWGVGWHNVALSNIRGYYGEKIGFYFAFLQYYTMSLIAPVVVGTIFFIVQLSEQRVDCTGIWVWIIFLILWNVLLCKCWRGYERTLRKKWGMSRYSEKAVPRPQFKGRTGYDEVSGSLEEFEHKAKRQGKQFVSYSTILFWAFLVIIAIYYLIIAKQSSEDSNMGMALAMANAIQIQVYNLLYSYMAGYLNNWENHRLQASYENNMIVKKIVFQVVNSFASLFFIGFFKPIYFSSYYLSTVQSEINHEVLTDLQIQLSILFFTLIVIQNTQEVVMSKLILKLCQTVTAETDPPPHTLDSSQPQLGDELIWKNLGEAYSPYSIQDLQTDAELQINQPRASNVMDNMSELIIEQGYATMFAIAFPLAPLLALANNFVEFRVDSRNLLVNQRPIPYPAYGVGLWGEVLLAFCGISVVTNWALFVFRTNQIQWFYDGDDSEPLRWTFAIGIGVIFLLIFVFNCFSGGNDDVHLERTEEIEKFLIIKGVKNSGGNQILESGKNGSESVEVVRIPQGISVTAAAPVKRRTRSVPLTPLQEGFVNLEWQAEMVPRIHKKNVSLT